MTRDVTWCVQFSVGRKESVDEGHVLPRPFGALTDYFYDYRTPPLTTKIGKVGQFVITFPFHPSIYIFHALFPQVNLPQQRAHGRGPHLSLFWLHFSSFHLIASPPVLPSYTPITKSFSFPLITCINYLSVLCTLTFGHSIIHSHYCITHSSRLTHLTFSLSHLDKSLEPLL